MAIIKKYNQDLKLLSNLCSLIIMNMKENVMKKLFNVVKILL